MVKCLGTLQKEVENFILRRASEFLKKKDRLIFVINNYDMMLQVITVSSSIMKPENQLRDKIVNPIMPHV